MMTLILFQKEHFRSCINMFSFSFVRISFHLSSVALISYQYLLNRIVENIQLSYHTAALIRKNILLGYGSRFCLQGNLHLMIFFDKKNYTPVVTSSNKV
jgi:hypothetical protein